MAGLSCQRFSIALAAGDVGGGGGGGGLIEDIVKPLPSLLLLLLPCPASLSERPLPQSLSSLNACSVTSLEMTPNGISRDGPQWHNV